jgi:hypothetical protein
MIGQKVEDLVIANCKLYALCDKKFEIVADPGKFSKDEIVELLSKDISLCKRRAQLKSAIDAELAKAIELGKMNVISEVKSYGA